MCARARPPPSPSFTLTFRSSSVLLSLMLLLLLLLLLRRLGRLLYFPEAKPLRHSCLCYSMCMAKNTVALNTIASQQSGQSLLRLMSCLEVIWE